MISLREACQIGTNRTGVQTIWRALCQGNIRDPSHKHVLRDHTSQYKDSWEDHRADNLPKQPRADRAVPCGCNTYQHPFRGTCDQNTDPASWTVTKVMLPAPDPPPLALRTVPAILPCSVIHCSVGAVVNSSRKSVSRTSSQRSLPYKGVNDHPIPHTSRGTYDVVAHHICGRQTSVRHLLPRAP